MNILTKDKYLNPYLAGVFLGIVLLSAFVFSGSGLGGSGAMMRTVVKAEQVISQNHVDNNVYLSKYGGTDEETNKPKDPWESWLIFEVLGVLVGGVLSGGFSNRLKVEHNKGPRTTRRQRFIFAFLGGALFGFGARIARGCTSGIGLSGGATLALGSWITLTAIFVGAFSFAYFFRKEWI